MAASGPGELIEIHERMNSLQYIEILEEVLVPSVRALIIPEPEPIYVVMDNSSVHNAIIVREWFEEHPDIIRIEWPARSPDLNPIENLWGHITNRWDGSNVKNKENLIGHAKLVWESLRPKRGEMNICERLVDSMPRRLGLLIDNNGSYSKY